MNPNTSNDIVSGEQYRYVLSNFSIAHEKVESQRKQLEEQEKQIALLRSRIALLEGTASSSHPGALASASDGVHRGGSSVDDVSIKSTASKLEKLISRWSADVVRTPPAPLGEIYKAILADVQSASGTTAEMSLQEGKEPTSMQVQTLLRHAMSETISEGIVNCLMVTDSGEANVQLTRIHEQIFARDPTVAAVWRRQTFTAAVETFSPSMILQILTENIPTLTSVLSPAATPSSPQPSIAASSVPGSDSTIINSSALSPLAGIEIFQAAYTFSRVVHGSQASAAGGSTVDAFYRLYVPELGTALHPAQVELVKRCHRMERNKEPDRVGATVFPGLVKLSRNPVPGTAEAVVQTVVRRAQVICECALYGV